MILKKNLICLHNIKCNIKNFYLQPRHIHKPCTHWIAAQPIQLTAQCVADDQQLRLHPAHTEGLLPVQPDDQPDGNPVGQHVEQPAGQPVAADLSVSV